MANTFVAIKKTIGLLNAQSRYCRDTVRLELIQEKADALEEVFDFAKEYVTFANHQMSSTVGDRLHYYLTDGKMNNQKVADRFGVPVNVVAGNVHYASRKFADLVEGQIDAINHAGDIDTVRGALTTFRTIKKLVVNPYDLPEVSEELLSSLSRRRKSKMGGVKIAKNKSQVIIP
ncbi:hypothetical protein PCCS19_21030 [Paenibacillus sp. CCS19]|uniref:hypothetical protein n=1 Tax=Paenibacillus sp. CCS19 TaxID=3158387 RepID=UPI00255FD8BD|nr:hypothetical protein [Paenibacillus cellulosilyticus]GMK39049.1 hypothetical protein PCCS19_21030 [Paenibacillus cellulosilyticus]